MLPKNYQDLKMNRGSNNTTSTLFATNNIAYTHIFFIFFLGGGHNTSPMCSLHTGFIKKVLGFLKSKLDTYQCHHCPYWVFLKIRVWIIKVLISINYY